MELLKQLEQSHVRLKCRRPLLPTENREMIGHAQSLLVGELVDGTMGSPRTRGVTMTIRGETSLLTYESERGKCCQPIKPSELRATLPE